MRPPEFTGGNRTCARTRVAGSEVDASMRPPEFTGGNRVTRGTPQQLAASSVCFNEAAGIHRRKTAMAPVMPMSLRALASMRPPEFTGGNEQSAANIVRPRGYS